MDSATWCRTPAAASAARRLRPEVSKNSSTALSSNEGELARSITTVAPAMASLSPSPVMALMPLLGEAATTSWPPWRRMATVFEPIRPVPPITTIFMVDLPYRSLEILDDWRSLNEFEKTVRMLLRQNVASTTCRAASQTSSTGQHYLSICGGTWMAHVRAGSKTEVVAFPERVRCPPNNRHRRGERHVCFVPLAEVIRSSSPPANTGCDDHSGNPACRNPSPYRARSSARRKGPTTSLRLETRSAGLSCRSRASALCACSGRPAIALLAAAIRNPG